MSGLRKILLLSLLALFIAGCSAVDWAYGNAPSLVAGRFDDAFDLDSEQTEQLETRLETFFTWHRSEELARYESLLDRAARDAADGIQADEILWLIDEVIDARKRALARAIDDFGDLASTLEPGQIEHFQAYFRERSEFYVEYLEKSEQQREIARVERNVERLEGWFGDFDEGMRERVYERLLEVPDIYQSWIAFREAQHRDLIAAMNDDSDADLMRARLKRILVDPDTDYARAFEAPRRVYWQAYAEAIADISGWLTRQQRQKAVAKLERYAAVASRLNGNS